MDSSDGLSPLVPTSKQTITITGLLVDVYGLDELPPSATHVSCLWLHHQRLSNKERLGDFAQRAVGTWNARVASGMDTERGLVALAFDHRNHGSRLGREGPNGSWREGNETHAQDMLGIIAGAVVDQSLLIDAVDGYLFVGREKSRTIDQHLALGVSLGGHSVWQSMFTDPRLVAGVVVIGCPDLVYLLTDRARLSRRDTFSAADNGASFLGSRDFPDGLIALAKKFDPKAMIFGTAPVASDPTDRERAKRILDERVRGKRFLLCSGGADKVVPYRSTQPFVDWFIGAAKGWHAAAKLSVENIVYPGIGHEFSPGMVKDSLRFIIDAAAAAPSGREEGKESRI